MQAVFLGYHIIDAAIKKGLEVFAAVRPNSNIDHLKALPLQFLYLNYEEEDDLYDQLADNHIDYIIHSAGITKATRQEAYNRVNATYTLTLARAAEKRGANFKKLVFISSLAALGPLKEIGTTITEATAPNPVTAYGRSKLLAETGLKKIRIPITILRPTAIYGPRDKDLLILLKTLSKGIDPYLGNFRQQLSFVHATDVAEVAVASLFIDKALGAYNITDGNNYNRYQFSDIARVLLKRKAVRLHIPMPLVRIVAVVLKITHGWVKKPSLINPEKLNELAAKNWVCDISKSKDELGFAPKFDLQTGLNDAVSWYRKNKWL